MDIEFIQQEHRNNIFKIMQLCNVQMAQAYQLYNNNNCNVENAVQAKFNSFGNIGNSYQQNNSKPLKNMSAQSHFKKLGHTNQKVAYDNDDYQEYKQFKQSHMNFNTRYEVRRKQGFLSGFFNKFSSSSQNNFKKKLQEFISSRVNIQLQIGNLSQALQTEYKTKSQFPLIVHIIDFDNKANKQRIKSIYKDQNLARKFKQEFKNYGISVKDYQLQTFLNQFIDLKSDNNSFVLLRINVLDQISLISKINILNLTNQQISKKLGQVKSKCINIQMEQHHMKNRYKQELRGNYDYQKPMSITERRKLQQDRQLRKKQQKQFYASMNTTKKQQQKSSNNNITSNNTSQGGQKQKMVRNNQVKKQQPKIIKKDLRKQAQQQRRKIRQSLKIYSESDANIINIKLRLPSSESIKLCVDSNQTAQYLYDFILSRQQNLGFQNDEQRRLFDVMQPYQKINLNSRKNQTLGKIFEGENMLSLVVSQIVQLE